MRLCGCPLYAHTDGCWLSIDYGMDCWYGNIIKHKLLITAYKSQLIHSSWLLMNYMLLVWNMDTSFDIIKAYYE